MFDAGLFGASIDGWGRDRRRASARGRTPALQLAAGCCDSRFQLRPHDGAEIGAPGVDFVRLQQVGGNPIDVPVQRGGPLPQPDLPDAVEILSGIADGDVLLAP